LNAINRQGTTEQAAEKLADSGKSGGKHPSVAKARRLYCCIYGTTEVVPFQNNPPLSSFSAACEVVPFQNNPPLSSFSAACEVVPFQSNPSLSSFLQPLKSCILQGLAR
jgi:hypothetical protein